jgi:putative ABC transport system permease protein
MTIQFSLALRYLSGRKLRTFLTTLAVVFGVIVIFGMNTLIPTLLQSFQTTMLAASDNVDLTISHKTGAAFPVSVLEAVRGVAGVRVAQGVLSRQLNLPVDFYDHDPKTPDRINVMSVVGVEPTDAEAMRNYGIQPGRFLQPGDTTAVVITQSLAEILGLKVGDRLALPTAQGQVQLSVVGVRPERAAPGGDEIILPLAEAQALLDAPGKVNIIEADFTAGDDAHRKAVEQAVSARLGSGYQYGPLDPSSNVFSSIRLAQTVFDVFGFLALFMGGFIIFNTFRTLVAERRRDLGLLRAVGASRGTIIGLILVESLVQGAIGTLAGMLLGYALGAFAMWAASPMMNSFIHMRLGLPVVTPGLVLVTVSIGLGVTLLAGLLPAISAGRVTPIEALRPAVAGVDYRKTLGASALAGTVLVALATLALLSGSGTFVTGGALLFLFGLVLVAPALVRPIALAFGALLARTLAREGTGLLAQGNLVRQPTRAAITASTSMVAMAILVVCGGLAMTISGSFMQFFRASLGSDFLLIPPAITVWGNNVGAGSGLVEQIKAVDGVGPVSSFRFAATTAEVKPLLPQKGASPAATAADGVQVSLLGIDPVAFPQVAGMRFIQGQPNQAYAALTSGRTMIINGILASTAGIHLGDSVPLQTLDGVQAYRVVGIASDFLNAKMSTGYISQASLAADFGKSEDVFIQFNLLPGANRAQVEARLKPILLNYPQFSLVAGHDFYEQTAGLIQRAFAGMYVLFIFLAVPSLIAMLNTLAIGVIERTREIGMLRAVGSTQPQVRRMILAEGLLLAALGTAFGLLAGLYLSYAMVAAFRLAGLPIDYIFPWNGLIFAAAVGLLFGALAALIPARQAAKLEIVQALRYE